MKLASHLASGRDAENLALAMLTAGGLRLLTRNYRCPQGELDLVMAEGETLVMVEVRYRRERGFGDAATSVDGRKQRKLLHAAQHFLLQDASLRRKPLRFDVVAVSVTGNGEMKTDWIKDAFRAD
ncbi:MAG: YraN family protein [Gammaproteobacteria bacterium]|nr:YraN family protein [Gammaproteobacteria bacterium]MDE2346252.1 YraN family protein [Gammaproteobacteria bacterium]